MINSFEQQRLSHHMAEEARDAADDNVSVSSDTVAAAAALVTIQGAGGSGADAAAAAAGRMLMKGIQKNLSNGGVLREVEPQFQALGQAVDLYVLSPSDRD